jgi:hypothetical protein
MGWNVDNISRRGQSATAANAWLTTETPRHVVDTEMEDLADAYMARKVAPATYVDDA